MKRLLLASTLIITLALVALLVPPYIDEQRNAINVHTPYKVSAINQAFHQSLFIGDWHSDSLLWNRNILERSDYGHMDIPRLQAGNVALQMFTTTTKSPRNQNYHHNNSNAFDNITLLAIVQAWPPRTWFNLTERALYQSEKLKAAIAKAPQQLMLITNQETLQQFVRKRKEAPTMLGALLGTEGSHALEGHLSNIDALYDAGFRMMSLQHFFDNKLGGSLHGQSNQGLTEFGRQVIERLNQKSIIIDVSHSSPQVVKDVLALSKQPIIVSHTGLQGFCDSARNIEDSLMKEIADKGGLIALGYWSAAACDTSPHQIAKQIAYGIELVGPQHISLGSDFDGAVTTALDTSEIAIITQELLNLGISKSDIRLVMGENMKNFLLAQLPQNEKN